jgi:hypothetical protein
MLLEMGLRPAMIERALKGAIMGTAVVSLVLAMSPPCEKRKKAEAVRLSSS